MELEYLKSNISTSPNLSLLHNGLTSPVLKGLFKGAIIRGRGTLSTSKVNNLTYHAHTTFIEIYNLHRPELYIAIAIAFAHTNVPLSSVRLPTSFIHPTI